MEHLLLFFAPAFDLYNLWVMLVGVLSGIMIGALPGLTATMGVTLLLPFTLGMGLSPQGSMAMLIGVYIGAIYGGSITAILIATPGTPASAATLLDGFPLSQRGEGGKAVVLATVATFVGGMIGILFLVFLSPQLSRFGLRFSSPEYFALAVFGLSMIVSISGGDVIKGILSGLFGLMLATVGLDPINGTPRFCFGTVDLYEGIGFIPVLIGLFAFAQVFEDITEKTKKVSVAKLKMSFPSIRELLKHGVCFVRSGVLGTTIGALPGTGCDIAAFVGYNEAKRFSKHPETFGKGNVEGIIAPESAKSGATAGALIPMITLGVPGDAVTAVMLNGLVIQGLQPGPLLFRDHLDVVYPIFFFIFMAIVVTCIIGLMSTRYIARIVLIDKSILLPIICVLSVMGAYAIHFSSFDVFVAIAMGAIGFVMRRWGFPASPIVLAMILGPMAEYNLRQALLLPGASVALFFTRPISAMFLIIALASVVFGLIRKQKDGVSVD